MVIRIALAALLLATPTAVSETTPVHETFTTADHPAGVAFEWTVPEGVGIVTVTATGGNGGESDPARPGGTGAVVTVAIPVEAGQVLSITLGADGTAVTGGGGFGSGGNGINAGGGGGSTGIVIDGTVSVVAGAGGGSSTANSAGGGGAAGTPDGQPGARRGGGGGTGGVGGTGVAPWGEPGGASFVGGGGTVNGSEAGAGGGAGYGGGGAGGAYGDGGGGGSYSATTSATYSARLDDLVDGWVQLDYLLPVPEVVEAAPGPVQQPTDAPDILGLNGTYVGMASAAIVVLFIGGLLVRNALRPARRRK
jgi:hypothetical protein